MGLRDKLISEENKKIFIVSDTDNYDTKNFYSRFEAHDSFNDKYVVTRHDFGEACGTSILGILDYEDEAINLAYIKAKEFAKDMLSLGCELEDKTSFKDKKD